MERTDDSAGRTAAKQVVALFNASDDTVEMVQRMLDASGFNCLVGCHFADLKKGRIDFARYLSKHEPDVVIFDISPPYLENWHFFKTLRDGKAMEGRGLVLTTTNKERLDETVGKDSEAFEIVGKPYDLDQIKDAIQAALKRTAGDKRRSPRPPAIEFLTATSGGGGGGGRGGITGRGRGRGGGGGGGGGGEEGVGVAAPRAGHRLSLKLLGVSACVRRVRPSDWCHFSLVPALTVSGELVTVRLEAQQEFLTRTHSSARSTGLLRKSRRRRSAQAAFPEVGPGP